MLLQMALFHYFFMTGYYSIVYMYHIFFIHSSVDGLLGCHHSSVVYSTGLGSCLAGADHSGSRTGLVTLPSSQLVLSPRLLPFLPCQVPDRG